MRSRSVDNLHLLLWAGVKPRHWGSLKCKKPPDRFQRNFLRISLFLPRGVSLCSLSGHVYPVRVNFHWRSIYNNILYNYFIILFIFYIEINSNDKTHAFYKSEFHRKITPTVKPKIINRGLVSTSAWFAKFPVEIRCW